jgi:hypothetical protein
MKTLFKLATGAAIAWTVVNLLQKRASRRAGSVAPPNSVPVESLEDSAGTPLSASPVLAARPADGV